MLERDKTKRERDEILDGLKNAVKEEGMKKHQWDEKAEDSLVSYCYCKRPFIRKTVIFLRRGEKVLLAVCNYCVFKY